MRIYFLYFRQSYYLFTVISRFQNESRERPRRVLFPGFPLRLLRRISYEINTHSTPVSKIPISCHTLFRKTLLVPGVYTLSTHSVHSVAKTYGKMIIKTHAFTRKYLCQTVCFLAAVLQLWIITTKTVIRTLFNNGEVPSVFVETVCVIIFRARF